ncbi:MAG: energy transducer TonB [Candidatus Sulfotelmatobacter sp.]
MNDRPYYSYPIPANLPGCISACAVSLIFCVLITVPPAVQAQSTSKAAHRKIVAMIEPEYPPVLKNGHFEGQVRLDATVLANGAVSKVEIKGGNPMLCQYAAQAVMHWKYAPGPAQTVEEVVFNFNANNR